MLAFNLKLLYNYYIKKGSYKYNSKETQFMKTISWLTEKGNVSVKARSLVKAQVNDLLKTRLGVEVFDSPKGLAFEVARDQAGHPIYAVIDATITQSLEVKEVASKAKATVEIDIPSLFE